LSSGEHILSRGQLPWVAALLAIIVLVGAAPALQRDFSEPGQDAPIRAAEFHPGNAGSSERVREDFATVGRMLLEI
jgi:hypothetical protein